MEPRSPINRVHLSKSRLTAFQRGHEVGAIALQDHPDGVMIGEDGDLGRALAQTTKLIESGDRRPLFAATFSHEDVLVRVNPLIPSGDGWHMGLPGISCVAGC